MSKCLVSFIATSMFFLSIGAHAVDLNGVALGDIESHPFVKCAIEKAISLTQDRFLGFGAVNVDDSNMIATLLFTTQTQNGTKTTVRNLSIKSTDLNGWKSVGGKGDRPEFVTKSIDSTAILTEHFGPPSPVNVDISSCD